jgi:hypothetical protein
VHSRPHSRINQYFVDKRRGCQMVCNRPPPDTTACHMLCQPFRKQVCPFVSL